MSVLSQIGFSGSRVALSLYALELGANQFTVGVLIGLFALCPMLLSIVIGKFSDRAAARLPVIIGSAALLAGMLLPPLSSTLITLGIAAFVLGFGHQTFSIPIEALVGGIDGPEKRARNYAVISMGWSFANVLGPLIAGFSIDHMGHVQAFLVLAAFVASPFLILWFKPDILSTVARHASTTARGGSVLDLWRIRPLRITIIASGVVGSAQDLFQFYLPVYGHAVGLSASAIGAILSMVAAAAFVIRGVIPFLVRKMTEAEILTAAVFISALAFTLLPFFVNAYALASIAFALGLGVGCAMPMTMSLLYVLSPPGRIAEAIGLHKTVRNTTHLVVPLVFGSIGAAFGYTTVFLSNAAVLAGSGMLMRRARIPDTGARR